jgi:adenine C2-methylase RlmN of 23S rRNA A2503 and tRNA A37
MYFLEGDNGPFWMTMALQAKTKHDRQLGTARPRNKTKIELLKDLRQSGYDTTKQRYRKDDLMALCGQRDIFVIIKECGVKEGWFGKPKGMLQILWEHGWIDATKVVSAQSMHDSKDGTKKILVRTGN